jgi:hypothetical protein
VDFLGHSLVPRAHRFLSSFLCARPAVRSARSLLLLDCMPSFDFLYPQAVTGSQHGAVPVWPIEFFRCPVRCSASWSPGPARPVLRVPRWGFRCHVFSLVAANTSRSARIMFLFSLFGQARRLDSDLTRPPVLAHAPSPPSRSSLRRSKCSLSVRLSRSVVACLGPYGT